MKRTATRKTSLQRSHSGTRDRFIHFKEFGLFEGILGVVYDQRRITDSY